MDVKRALVLSGGGSRGAYEIGAWRALRELGVRLDGVYGTSIGALNAALVARGDVEAAVAVWQGIDLSSIIAVPEGESFAIDHMISNKRDVIPFLLENVRRLGVDITPLQNLVRAECDEGRIRASGMELGVMTFRVPQMQGVPMRLSDMQSGTLGDWIIASASCFPIFPARVIAGQRYIDGGYYDNLPVDMALRDGADEVIAVELKPDPVHPEYARMPWLTEIRPRHSLGGFLDFNPKLMARSLRLGYQDAMKRYGRFEGWRYTFRRSDDLSILPQARRYAKRLNSFDAEFMRRGAIYAGQPVNAPLTQALEAETESAALAWKDLWLRGLELVAEVMGYRVDAIYQPDALIGQARSYCRAQGESPRLDESALHAAWKAGSRQTFALLTAWLDANGEFPQELLRRLGELPRETAAALFLHTLDVMGA